MEFLKCPFITKGFSLIVLDSSEYSFRPRYPASPEETASQISEKTGLSGRDLTLLWTNDEVHTDDLFNPKKDFFKVTTP